MLLALIVLACGLTLAPATAGAAVAPKVKSISPKKAKVGATMTIRGTGFVKGANKNTVIFRNPDGRAVFAKAKDATTTKLVVSVPDTLQGFLTKKDDKPLATRFQLRILSRKFGPVTSRRLSPVITPSDGDGAAADCGSDGPESDQDKDLLSDDLELKAKTDPCKADTDGDKLEDGWEYWSAKDLNVKAVPYPGKKPWPNPLDPSDPGIDYDGDELTSADEHGLWAYTGKSFNASLADSDPALESPLGYSDGTQTSAPARPTQFPAWKSQGLPAVFASYPDYNDYNGDGMWSDDERDADKDGASNVDETHARLTAKWWDGCFEHKAVDPWPKTSYGSFKRRPFQDGAATDPDVDGDGLLDAEDDQDVDGEWNLTEMLGLPDFCGGGSDTPPNFSGGRPVNPFNPCAPNTRSRTCPRYVPFG